MFELLAWIIGHLGDPQQYGLFYFVHKLLINFEYKGWNFTLEIYFNFLFFKSTIPVCFSQYWFTKFKLSWLTSTINEPTGITNPTYINKISIAYKHDYQRQSKIGTNKKSMLSDRFCSGVHIISALRLELGDRGKSYILGQFCNPTPNATKSCLCEFNI